MSLWDDPNARPECSQVLAKYNEWSINKNYLKTDSTFDSTLKLIQQNDYKFFAEYFNAKYEEIEAKLENIHLNSFKPFSIEIDYKSSFNEYYDKTFDEISVIGSGGFGTVLRVKHKSDGQLFAVKCIKFNGNIFYK